ncbi:hypothetical protein DRN97_00130 [Methanosarcinales archaeon]|nr:MAG: hypothetical protein DRN97_00130 [Methanosarcinales archaeon]
MWEELDKIEKELKELREKKADLYTKRKMLFTKLKSEIILLRKYIELAEKQVGSIQDTNIMLEIKQISNEINRILGFSSLPSSNQEEIAPIPEIEEEIKQIEEAIESKTAEQSSIIRNS